MAKKSNVDFLIFSCLKKIKCEIIFYVFKFFQVVFLDFDVLEL